MILVLPSLFIFVFGLVVGSFLNCLIYRLETDQSFITGRSFCPHCRHVLGWPDLIPLLSFAWLRGRCRYCQKPISLQYPLVELATGGLFVLVFGFWKSEFGIGIWNLLDFVYLLAISSFLIVVFVFDLKHYLIPDEIIYPAVIVSLIYRLFEILNFGNWSLFGNWKLEIGNSLPFVIGPLLSAAGAALFFFSIYFFSRGRAMGFGDVKLAFLIGLVLGFPQTAVALLFAFWSGSLIGLVLMLWKKKTLKSELPFGPFLVAGVFFAWFFGQAPVDWYGQFLLP
jgi:prepilin signal peptidase PulO-like enzyme (type II secretory pathway)